MSKPENKQLNAVPTNSNPDKASVIVNRALISAFDKLEQTGHQLREDNQTQEIAIGYLTSFILFYFTPELNEELISWLDVDLYTSTGSKLNRSRALAIEELLEQTNSDDLREKLTALLQRHTDFEEGKLKPKGGFFVD